MKKDIRIFHCPRCGRPAEQSGMIDGRTYANEASTIPYFICGKCRLIFVNKRLVHETLRQWWQRNKLKQIIPFTQLYHDALDRLNKYVVEYFKNIGYTSVRFIKKQPSKK